MLARVIAAPQAEVVSIEDGVSRVTNWILGPGETLLNARQNVGYDVSSAEDLKRNHESLELRCRVSTSRLVWAYLSAYVPLIG